MAATMSMWVIYEHPKDDPQRYVAREWQIYPGAAIPSKNTKADQDLHVLRQQLDDLGLICMQPDPKDDPAILEVWI